VSELREQEQRRQEAAIVQAVRSLIHTNACSDENGWFAFWQPDEGDDPEKLFGERVTQCDNEAQAVERFLRTVKSRLQQAESERPPCRLPGVEKAIAEVRRQMAEATKQRLANGGGR
jgi:hypothetical protein